MSSVVHSKSLLSEEDFKNFNKLMNFKTLWKDRAVQENDLIANSVCIEPFRTLSKYHSYMKKPLVLIPDTDEIVYVSGCNIIVEDLKTKNQRILPLKKDGTVINIDYHLSIKGEKILLVTEKVLVRKKTGDSKLHDDYEEKSAGRMEIVFLKNLDVEAKKNIIFETENYLKFNHYIYDCVMVDRSPVCFIIIKSLEKSNKKETQIFTWDFLGKTITNIEILKSTPTEDLSFDEFVLSPFFEDEFLCFNKSRIAVYKMNYMKKCFKKVSNDFLTLEKESDEKITTANFFVLNNSKNIEEKKGGIFVTFKSEWMDIYMIDGVNKNERDGETSLNYNKFLRLNYFSYLDANWVEVLTSLDSESEGGPNIRGIYTENLIPFNVSAFVPNFAKDKKVPLSGNENYISLIVPCKNYLFVFLNKTNIIITIEFIPDDEKEEGGYKAEISSIDKLNQEIVENTHIEIDDKMTKMVIVLPNFPKPDYTKDSIGAKITKVEDENIFQYKITYVVKSPNFVYEGPILANSIYGLPIDNLHASESPKVIACSVKDAIYVYFQRLKENEETFNKNRYTENGNQNYIHLHTNFYLENSEFRFLTKYIPFTTKEEKKGVKLIEEFVVSPLGRDMFVSGKEKGILLSVIGNSVEEVMKVNQNCKACTFDDSGNYLAFSSSVGIKEGEYNINVFNMNSYQYDYIIKKVASPIKLKFVDGSKILIIQCESNIYGINLTWKSRLIDLHALTTTMEEDLREQPAYAFKLNLVSEFIHDFIYDVSLDYSVLISNGHKTTYFKQTREYPTRKIEFYSNVQYLKMALLKRYDSLIFGTETGCLRCTIFPFPTPTDESEIIHPDFNEISLHGCAVTSLDVSKDNTFIYSGGADGSIFVCCVTSISNDLPTSLTSFVYFNPKNYLPKTVYCESQDIELITENNYNEILEDLKKEKEEIQKKISLFTSQKEKAMNENNNELLKKKSELEKELIEIETKAKKLESLHEEEVKKLSNETMEKERKNTRELEKLKAEKKVEKKKKQEEAKELETKVKIATENFEKAKKDLEEKKKKTNEEISKNLEEMYQILLKKKEEIHRKIKEKQEEFEKKCEETEAENEKTIKDKQEKFKQLTQEYEEKSKELENEISKRQKDNRNYDEKIVEWENHLKELEQNNQELMETYIFNILKLSQMNKLLSENEEKISTKEKIVKEKRAINDRLEQLRFVLEYQINNLIQEKTPIEEQIKNFESLHSDFYKRFNLLYTELLKIAELIENNKSCIEKYRKELKDTKKMLYEDKNLYKSIDVKLNSIIKSKIENKAELLKKIQDVYDEYLDGFKADKKEDKVETSETKLQTKNIEKEIFHQKNNVLRELIEKRAERKRINLEKEEMMKDIRLDNQLLIMECSNIRENLEDIMKNINDIEKKFIELTNNNIGLQNNEDAGEIKKCIRKTKEEVLLSTAEKKSLARKINAGGGGSNVVPQGVKLSKINKDIDNVNILPNADELLRRQMMNAEEMKHQEEEVSKMQRQLEQLVGDGSNKKTEFNDSNAIHKTKKVGLMEDNK